MDVHAFSNFNFMILHFCGHFTHWFRFYKIEDPTSISMLSIIPKHVVCLPLEYWSSTHEKIGYTMVSMYCWVMPWLVLQCPIWSKVIQWEALAFKV